MLPGVLHNVIVQGGAPSYIRIDPGCSALVMTLQAEHDNDENKVTYV